MKTSDKYQTVLLPKSELDKIRDLAKLSRYPMTRIICYALVRLMADDTAVKNLMEGRA